MGRKQRTLDPATGPVAEFALQLRALRDQAGTPTFATMSRRAHRSVSVLSEAAGGVEFPTWPTVLAFVQACGEVDTDAWLERWEQVRSALADNPGPPRPVPDSTLASEPALSGVSAGPAAGTPEATGVPAAAQPRPLRWPIHGARTVVALAVGLTVGLVTGMNLPRSQEPAATAAAPSPHATASVVIVPPLSPAPWPAAGSGCGARTQWVYQFDHAYMGQVYVLLAVPTARGTTTDATITWGAWRWHQSVAVEPGDPTRDSGGTLLLFNKLDTSLRDPIVTVETTAPTCAAFGTASGTAVAPLTTVDANQGWNPIPTPTSSAPR